MTPSELGFFSTLLEQAPQLVLLAYAVYKIDIRLERLEAVIRERDGDLIRALLPPSTDAETKRSL